MYVWNVKYLENISIELKLNWIIYKNDTQNKYNTIHTHTHTLQVPYKSRMQFIFYRNENKFVEKLTTSSIGSTI